MQLTSLSWQAHKPCVLLKWPNVSILLDCALDTSSFSHFLPFVYSQISRFKAFPPYQGAGDVDYLRQVRNNVFVDALPEVHPTPLEAIPMETVNCILVSNWQSLIALPFYVSGSGFRGSIYATDPVVQFGKLMMEELVEFFERIVVDEIDSKWKDPSIFGKFANLPNRNPLEWKKFYTRDMMEKTIAETTTVSFNQTITIEGSMQITAHNSGYSIGSSNWVILADGQKIAYMAASSYRTTHTRHVNLTPLKNADHLILTSIARVADNNPEGNTQRLGSTMVETLRRGGNVLMPINPVGVVFDLLEWIVKQVDASGVGDVPIYFVSPMGKSALAYSNVSAEWLSEAKQNLVYVPDEPFQHSQMVRDNRIRVYDSIYGTFSREFKSPCVVITGHPSLRIGDAPHLLEMWGNDHKNCVIITDPDFPIQEVYGPFEDLAIQAFYCPIETRLDFSQLNSTVLPDLKPKNLLIPDVYTKPLVPGKNHLVVQYKSFTPLRYNEVVSLSTGHTGKRKVKVHSDLLKYAKLAPKRQFLEVGLCALRGQLNTHDNVYELDPYDSVQTKAVYTGTLPNERILKALAEKGYEGVVDRVRDGCIIHIAALGASITVNHAGSKTNIRADKEHRKLLADVVKQYLEKLV